MRETFLHRKRKHLALALAAIVVALGCAAYYFIYADFTRQADCTIYIRDGETTEQVFARLDSVAAPGHAASFRFLARMTGYGPAVRTGHYLVSKTSTLDLLRHLKNGIQEPVRIHVPVVNLPQDLAKRLAKKLATDSASFATAFADSALLSTYDLKPAELFCMILPDTYELYWDLTPKAFLDRMKRENKRFWNDERQAKAKAAGLTPKEVVTLASIVEKETANKEEKPTIAGLYLNRLRKGMKLGADPTVKFAVGDFALRRILNKHLQTDSPYNTYQHEGLPPGPICLPERESIEAVLNYEPNEYLYMCAKEDFSGRHNFARTGEEHMANARRYQKALNERGIR